MRDQQKVVVSSSSTEKKRRGWVTSSSTEKKRRGWVVLEREGAAKREWAELGGKAGKVIYVDLKENNPASWGKYLKILIEKDFTSPLFSGCFFDLDSGVKRWPQFKYEQVGIFCYFCGRLGHQRRGCTLTSPELVTSDNGIPFPLFGSWLSTSSTYRDVFSSANSFSPCPDHSGYALFSPFRRPSKVVALVHGDGGFRRTSSILSRGSRRSGMVTKRGFLSAGTSH
ncbi:hypothetical protein G4B88_018747 [Cannabis sativa]|uniref:CCHC-type domain-containing protein n=1 Tax=Cannabis sativa TaxID=3483 RepID=A0A7J6HZJ7_CANSA|nr:hypothetical protein G4B88_018747 [Cannabis sativa]